ncbi:hypothetical protein PS467_26435 [Streptomyces luomodiensis]|uniref:Translation initiation factor IF-2 n=1 Tax=Streptomyces luomodiensis TaxID=3026192 RepID=A0ABY9V2W1_9ACTN|nr:hypothetical protein [Streptomyces sp. SCA4-21]WNE98617.1 hypothetical protein PS467_26435 [Streptomyces sp. SCA4-21]
MDPQSDVAERAPSRPLRADVARKGPVFVDLSGRRGRLVRHVGVVAGAACLGYSAVLGLGYAGGTSLAPHTLIPGRPVATEAFGREPKHAPEGRSGPSASDERPDAHEYAPTHRQHRRHRYGSGRPESSGAREPDALHPVTTRPRPAPAQPAEPEPHRAAPRHSPARAHAGGRKSTAGHRSGKHRELSPAHPRPAARKPARAPANVSHTPSRKPTAAARPSAEESGHPQDPGRTTGPGHAKSPQQPQTQGAQARKPQSQRPQSQRRQPQRPQSQRPQSHRPQSQRPQTQRPQTRRPQSHQSAQAQTPELPGRSKGPAAGGAEADRPDAPVSEGEES